MQERLQDAVIRSDKAGYEAILFGYALCGNGLLGLTAFTVPLVIPRAHDCITLLLGSRQQSAQSGESAVNPVASFPSRSVQPVEQHDVPDLGITDDDIPF